MELSPSAAETAYKKIGDPVLLNKIDKLFACNVGEYIEVPQLVVVSDQSSGKSSVLEGLTRLPFPRDSGLCIKFATQITFQRAANYSIKNKSNIKQLNAPAFATIMSNVHTIIGLSSNIAQASGLRKTFSNDVLHLEIHGLDKAYLSVINVPGIFRTTTTDIITTTDKELIRHMVETYMRNPRTVMLIVIPANVNPTTQEMAKEVNPNRHRTIGVLTKPDLIDKGAEQKIVDICCRKAASSCAIKELFFRCIASWNTLSQEVLTQHIRRKISQVEINKKLGVYKYTLDSLTKYLLNLIMQFQYIADLTIKADYRGDGIFDMFTSIRLTTELISRNEKFSLDEILSVEDQVAGPSRLDIFDWLKTTNAVALVHNFITTLLQSLCSDDQVSERLLNLLLDGLLEKYSKSLIQAKFLLNVELLGVPITLNHYFNDNLEKRHGSVVPLNLIMKNHPMNNADHTIRDMHDILYAYYKVARKRFVDNVYMHAAGYHLIHGPDTPLKLFSPSFVLELTQGQLQEIAGEDSSLKRKRAQLKKEIQDLEAGRKILM
ncbi:hypothetical protein K469DRAFT_739242 [Zopfia rhizophila CBS 207.26]|uniref:GED domain-containing protein n=1 Tax=Zopfia rhizophila CBS 207.26 TaxID=1314779 RepID=A0A6A6E0L4_9PEZI|nr:hypothetical protein K469DRAFT_739242 [Zopfia rhizophila CBS 207.26]